MSRLVKTYFYIFGHSLPAIEIGLSIYSIVSEKDNLSKSELAKGLEELADSIEEKIKMIELLRDACIKLKNIRPEECIQNGKLGQQEVKLTKCQAGQKSIDANGPTMQIFFGYPLLCAHVLTYGVA